GQPQPLSNFESLSKSFVLQAAHWYSPSSKCRLYFPVWGASVPFFLKILYWSAVRIFFHSSSVFSNLYFFIFILFFEPGLQSCYFLAWESGINFIATPLMQCLFPVVFLGPSSKT